MWMTGRLNNVVDLPAASDLLSFASYITSGIGGVWADNSNAPLK